MIAGTEEDCWQACCHVASLLNFLGLQDASRKWWHCDQEAEAWAGSIVHTTGGAVKIMVSSENWEKTKAIVQWISEELSNPKGVDHKQLEKHRGSPVYVSCTYPAITPYLKGIHLSLDS
jgi:hypothetical protein